MACNEDVGAAPWQRRLQEELRTLAGEYRRMGQQLVVSSSASPEQLERQIQRRAWPGRAGGGAVVEFRHVCCGGGSANHTVSHKSFPVLFFAVDRTMGYGSAYRHVADTPIRMPTHQRQLNVMSPRNLTHPSVPRRQPRHAPGVDRPIPAAGGPAADRHTQRWALLKASRLVPWQSAG